MNGQSERGVRLREREKGEEVRDLVIMRAPLILGLLVCRIPARSLRPFRDRLDTCRRWTMPSLPMQPSSSGYSRLTQTSKGLPTSVKIQKCIKIEITLPQCLKYPDSLLECLASVQVSHGLEISAKIPQKQAWFAAKKRSMKSGPCQPPTAQGLLPSRYEECEERRES